MRAPSRLSAFRARANSLMADTCKVTAPGAGVRGPLNPATGKYDSAPAAVTVYEGQCRLGRVDIPHVSQASSGEATVDTQDSVLHLPLAGSKDVVTGCTVSYLTSSVNPALAGRRFGVVGIVGGTNLTARRCLVREVTAD